MEFLNDKDWKCEVQGPFDIGKSFEYLKRKIDRTYEGFVIRPGPKHIEDIAQKADIKIGNYKKTPARSDLGKRDGSAELLEVETSHFRSIVGKMLYIGGERPDCQHAINALAAWMSKPTRTAWRHAEHLASYLVATEFYGLLIKSSRCGKSMLDMREMQDVEVKKVHLLEVVTDSDYAGDQNSRKSITSFQVFLDGNLMESRVRSQKSISLSSGESEYVAMVSGCSEGLFLRHVWSFIRGHTPALVCRSDSSPARGMCSRVGIGRTRHLDAVMMWLQQKCHEKVIRVTAIPTSINSADIGTKALARARMRGLMFMLNMVDEDNREIGEDEFHEIERKMMADKGAKKILGTLKGEYRMALVVAFANMISANGAKEEEEPNGAGSEDWSWMLLAILAGIGALSLVRWLWLSFITRIKKEIKRMPEKATAREFEDSVPEVSEARRPKQARLRHKTIRITPTGTVFHTHEKCPHYKGGRALGHCAKCCGYEGSMSD